MKWQKKKDHDILRENNYEVTLKVIKDSKIAEFKEQWEKNKLPKELTQKKCCKKPKEIEVLRFNLPKMMAE